MSGAIPITLRLKRVAESDPWKGCDFAACGCAPGTARAGRIAFHDACRPILGREPAEPMLLQVKAPS